MKNKLFRGKEFIAEKLDMSIDAMIDIPKIIITGKEEITIENHKGIVAFSEDEIKVSSKKGIIKIQGNNFEIFYMGSNSLTINGEIRAISYEGKSYEEK
ncbi:MAG: sporulation protein YqfC [Clostridium sp.]